MNLKIFEFNPHLRKLTDFEVMTTDITIINGIIKGEPTYEKGRKISTGYYLDRNQTDLAIEKKFKDVIENNHLVGLEMTLIWYDVFGNIALSKDVYIPLSISENAEITTKRRKRAINYLQEAGARMGVKSYIDSLFNFYSTYQSDGVTKNLLNSFIENGSNEFETVIEAETNTQIKAILDAQLPDGNTVKQAILNQIT